MNFRRLIKIVENDAEDEASYARDEAISKRQKMIEQLIARAFKQLGLTIATDVPWAISYDEDGREAIVVLDDEPNGWPLNKLAMLYKSGLSDVYFVVPKDNLHLEIRFIVSPDLMA